MHLKWHLRRQVIYFLDSYFLLVSLMYTQSVKYHIKYKHGFKCLREMGDVVPPQTNTGKVLCICSHLDMCSHYVFPLYSAVTGKASAKVLGRFNLWIIMQLFLTVATILLLVQVTHSNVSFFWQELCTNFGGCRQDITLPCGQQNKWIVCQDIWYRRESWGQQIIKSSKRNQVIKA